jgi:hypothetical protein
LDDRAKFWADLERSNGSLREIEVQARSQRGTVHTLLVSAESIEINREPHLFLFALDITERKQAEAELLRTGPQRRNWGSCEANSWPWCRTSFAPRWVSSSHPRKSWKTTWSSWSRPNAKIICSPSATIRAAWAIMEEALFIGSFDAGKMEFKPATVELRKFLQGLVDEVLSTTGWRCPIELSFSETPAEIQADERLLHTQMSISNNHIEMHLTESETQLTTTMTNEQASTIYFTNAHEHSFAGSC